MKEDWSQAEPEEFSKNLQQRTEELYRIPDAEADSDGLIECAVFVMRDMLVFPAHDLADFHRSRAQSDCRAGLADHRRDDDRAVIQQNPEVDEPGPEDFLPIGVEIAVGRLLSLADGNSSALVQGRRRVEIVEFIQTEPFLPRAGPSDLWSRSRSTARWTR